MPQTHSSDSKQAYRSAGVDLDRADTVVEIAKRLAKETLVGSAIKTLGGIGSFSGAFELPAGYQQPVMLSACDGVGTKLKIAIETGLHHTVGIDLVAMSVNDILANGGKPLIFLDYVATSEIDPQVFEQILTGIKDGCKDAGCALLGGETAEMPGFYPKGDYDLAGFCLGIVEKSRMLPKMDRMQAGDVLIGLSSSGFHSNGYSLVRKVVSDQALAYEVILPELGTSLAEALLEPTKIYVQPVLNALEKFPDAIHGLAHITGGGLIDNLPRVLPQHLNAAIDSNSWPRPAVYNWLQTAAELDDVPLDDLTMAHTFNWGIGFVLVVKADTAHAVLEHLRSLLGEDAVHRIGVLTDHPQETRQENRVILQDIPVL